MENPDKELFTYREVSELLNVRLGTLYSWVGRRQIPHLRLGPRVVRFSSTQIQQWLQSRSVSSGKMPEAVDEP